MRILITGATGFVGSHFLDKISSDTHTNYSIYCISRTVTEKRNVHWLKGDLFNHSFVSETMSHLKPDILVHLAWDVSPGFYLDSNNNIQWLETSKFLIDEFVRNGGKRIITSGTCFEYNLEYGYLRVAETPLKEDTSYASAKIQLNDYIKKVSNINNVSYIWTRLFYMYGPRENKKRLVPHIVLSLLENKKPCCTVGDQLRDYMYVEDVAEILNFLVNSTETGEINISSGYPVTIKEIGKIVEKILDKENQIEFGAIVNKKNEPHVIMGDPINKKINIGPLTTIEKGIEKTIKWWKDEIHQKRME